MCGIAGWVGESAGKNILKSMTDAVMHRGPDGSGQSIIDLKSGATAGFGHRRLSILDLGGGAQPMASPDGRLTITFNGEIYNYIELREELVAKGYSFQTDNSDTEVLLQAWAHWGPECLPKLQGMFAFALHDARTDAVYLARDPFGKKPLFRKDIHRNGRTTLLFASEIASLLCHPDVEASLDEAALFEHLMWRYVPAPNTFFEGIKKIPPGSYVSWQNGEIKEVTYWTPPEAVETRRAAPKDPVAEFTHIFDEAVAFRLRADVPVGMFLSSGIDSTSVLSSVVAQGAADIRCYSVGYDVAGKSELDDAQDIAKHFGVPSIPIILDPMQMQEHLGPLAINRGAPVTEPADIAMYLMSERAVQDVKVVLTGDGADEMLSGYPKHIAENTLGYLPGGTHKLVGQMLGALPTGRRGAIASKALKETDAIARQVVWFGGLDPKERAAMWIGQDVSRQPDPGPFSPAANASALRRVLHFDQTSWLPDNMLERLDRVTMANSLEARSPFMDVRLAEFASSLPDSWRLKGKTTKRILREAMNDRLPHGVLGRKKKGFPIPVGEWFRTDLREPLQDLLSTENSIVGKYLDPAQVQTLINQHVSGEKDQDKQLWMLFSLETFLQSSFGTAAK